MRLKSSINAANRGFLRQSKSNDHTVRIRFGRLKKKNVQVPDENPGIFVGGCKLYNDNTVKKYCRISRKLS